MASHMTGIDIGEKTLKLAHFVNGNLKKFASVDLPDNMISEGQIVSTEALSALIKETAKSNGIPRKDAALVLPSSLVHVRTVKVPVMSESQLKYNLPFEFKDYLTEDKNKYRFDYEVLETIMDAEGKATEQRLFACAALKAEVEKFRVILARAGYILKFAVPEEYIYSKLFRGDCGIPAPAPEVCALVDLGHTGTRIHILRKGEYDTRRVVDLGISTLEEITAERSFTDVHMAQSYLRTNHDDIQSDKHCVEFYNRLSVEVLKAVNFYNYNNRELDLKDIYIIGGGALIKPLVDTIQQVTAMNIHSAAELIAAKDASYEPALAVRAFSCAAKL